MSDVIRVVVVDDEQLAREELCYQLEQLGDIEVDRVRRPMASKPWPPSRSSRRTSSSSTCRCRVSTGSKWRAGFSTDEDPPAVVFVTAFDRHAIEAFDVNALDYLLKPVEAGRLDQTLQRARKRLAQERSSSVPMNDQLEKIVKMMADRQIRREQVAIKVGERFMLVQADEIIYASLADESINIVTGQVTGLSNYRTLDDLQARLDPEVFWRVHRSHLVNINKIKEIVPWFSRNYILRMKDVKGTEIPVSRSQTKRLREYLKL